MKLQNLTTITTTLALAVLIGCTNKSKPQTLPTETQPTQQDANSLKDPRDGKTYKIVKIGEQVWMLDNLNYEVEGSRCYGEGGKVADSIKMTWTEVSNFPKIYYYHEITLSNSEVQANCEKYGRLYNWATAMALPDTCDFNSCSSYINTKHNGICPSGWHIPSFDDWKDIHYDSELSDLLSGACCFLRNTFYDVDERGYWWSSTEYSTGFVTYWSSHYDVAKKDNLFSVRCIKDD